MSNQKQQMTAEQLIRFVSNQKNNWGDINGDLVSFDSSKNEIIVEERDIETRQTTGKEFEFNLNNNASNQLLQKMNIKGVMRDFENDDEFIQSAIDRRIDQRIKESETNKRKKLMKVIYSENEYGKSGLMEAKGIASHGYQMVQNYDIVEEVMKQFGGNFDPVHSFVDDERMFMNITNIAKSDLTSKNFISKEAAKKYNAGDVIGFGFAFGNSMVRLASMTVSLSMMRLVCNNGMLSSEVEDISRNAHINKDMLGLMRQGMKKVWEKRKDHISLLSRASKKAPILTNETMIVFDEDKNEIERTIKAIDKLPTILKQIGIPKRHYSGIREAYDIEPIGNSDEGINGWEIYNAITRYNTHLYPKTDYYNNYESQTLMSTAYSLLTL